jgi:transposase
MPQNPQLSSDIRGQIIGMSRSNKSAREIGRELGISYTTVAYTIRRFKKTGSNANMPKSGRPTLLTERDKNHLARTVKTNRFKPLREIVNHEPINVSVDTARRGLKERGVDHYVAAKKPKITPTNVQKRKDWCQDVAGWTDEEWKKVIWSDESSVELGLSSRKVMVWRSQGQRYQADCLAPNRRSGRISVMFWSCFWQDELGPLVALPKGSVNSARYCEILEEHLFPFYSAVKAAMGHEPWFMEDNARVHTSAETRAFKDDLEIRTMAWPPQSPDLNPIENLWKLWKHIIQKTEPFPKNREELIAAAQAAWEELKTTNIGQILADSIRRRIAAVKAAKGHPTKY